MDGHWIARDTLDMVCMGVARRRKLLCECRGGLLGMRFGDMPGLLLGRWDNWCSKGSVCVWVDLRKTLT